MLHSKIQLNSINDFSDLKRLILISIFSIYTLYVDENLCSDQHLYEDKIEKTSSFKLVFWELHWFFYLKCNLLNKPNPNKANKLNQPIAPPPLTRTLFAAIAVFFKLIVPVFEISPSAS